MGFGLPSAIGAQLADLDRTTIVVTGHGSIQMNIQELATIKQENLPVKVICLNNGYLGMVRQWQELFWQERYSHVDMNTFGGEEASPDFVKLADAYGIRGVRLTDPATLEDDLRAVIEAEGPAFVDVRVVRDEKVYPMIAPGEAARDMVG
jgi:acetolactate synthase-1/2/3 large subunit